MRISKLILIFLGLMLPSVLRAQGTGSTFQCVAPGTVTITARNGGINGSATLNCSNAGTSSLLHGCTVSFTNTVNFGSGGCPASIPSGWSLAIAQGFESGSLGPNEVLGFAQLVSTKGHTGTHSVNWFIPPNNASLTSLVSSGGSWFLHGAGVGCCTNGEVYMSWWNFLDPTAKASGENNFGAMLANNATGQQGLLMDTENPSSLGTLTTTMNLWISPQSNDPTASGCLPDGHPKNCGFFGPLYNLNLGTWEQNELWIHQGTCTGGVPNNDGFIRFYINGTLAHSISNANVWNGTSTSGGNLNGCVNMGLNPSLQIGGAWTYFVPLPTGFNEYIDDIIVLKR